MKNELSVKGAAMEKKVALVTGASRGIGRQISLTLAKEGMFVVINYCGSEARAKDVLEEIRKMVAMEFFISVMWRIISRQKPWRRN